MTKKEKAIEICRILEEKYPDALCSLTYSAPHELMIAGRLSAQCTDARVNIVTKDLFARYKSIQDFADADVKDIKTLSNPAAYIKPKQNLL